MRVIETLPDRPVTSGELETLQSAERVRGAFYRFWTSDPAEPGQITGQFTLLLEGGRGFALHFDLDAAEWTLVASIDDYADIEDAHEQLDPALEAARGDDEEYGKRLLAFQGGGR